AVFSIAVGFARTAVVAERIERAIGIATASARRAPQTLAGYRGHAASVAGVVLATIRPARSARPAIRTTEPGRRAARRGPLERSPGPLERYAAPASFAALGGDGSTGR